MKRKTAKYKTNGFEGVVEGASNKAAVAAAKRVAAGPVDDRLNPLALVGPSGCGKTRILNAIAAAVASKQDGRTLISTTGERLLEDYVHALENGSVPFFREKFKMADILIVDGADSLVRGTHLMVEVLGIFNELIENDRQVVVAVSRPFKELKKTNQKLYGRISSGATVKLCHPDEAMKRRYIKKYLSAKRATLPEATIKSILDSPAKSFWEVKGAVCTALCEKPM